MLRCALLICALYHVARLRQTFADACRLCKVLSGLKKILLGLIDRGLTPCPFFEGEYTSRLKYLTELPKGKVLAWFDRVDLVKAKEMLRGIACIGGNMPASVLQFGPAERVREETRRLIEVAGKDGGLIMASRSVLDEADPKLVKLWAEATREYGVF